MTTRVCVFLLVYEHCLMISSVKSLLADRLLSTMQLFLLRVSVLVAVILMRLISRSSFAYTT